MKKAEGNKQEKSSRMQPELGRKPSATGEMSAPGSVHHIFNFTSRKLRATSRGKDIHILKKINGIQYEVIASHKECDKGLNTL